MRGERDELENALDVELAEACLAEPLRRALADEPLSARARVDPGRLHADEPARALGRRCRQTDQRDHLLRRQAGYLRLALERVARRDADLGPQRALAVDDVRGDVLREILDQERFADHDLFDRLLEELREARHVDALAGGPEVDRTVDLGRDQLLGVAVTDADRLLEAAHSRMR